ncbi:hypothetical protein [Salmonella phage SD-13_S19]|nr:hypothetical protein [Salmonella phage SD-11_S17]WPK20296.1 hypothetical protein [Salmonella phage SD-12_S18]WPK20433.1 hypothetical protein [Salmonella phage SD-13_S19]WPK20522.1 hypothetical protein [Salmonella phage SD-14_S20]
MIELPLYSLYIYFSIFPFLSIFSFFWNFYFITYYCVCCVRKKVI